MPEDTDNPSIAKSPRQARLYGSEKEVMASKSYQWLDFPFPLGS